MLDFEDFFKTVTKLPEPMDWQRTLAEPTECTNRTIRIPTGFGKTLGVLSTWMWHRLYRRDESWPRRLVWCLPMRVLAEQTRDVTRDALDAMNWLWKNSEHKNKVGVHLLMGGTDSGDWQLYPEENAVLIGTQDMLLSRALNRGYASPRARWPMEFGLLNQDCLWIMDEIQLMDVGLATSAQLQAFRGDDAANGKSLRPSFTWWMSATLQPDWLQKSPDTTALTSDLPETRISSPERVGRLWDPDQVSKPLVVERFTTTAIAKRLVDEHIEMGRGAVGPTLVVLNTVERAIEVFNAIEEKKRPKSRLADTDIRLIHSRFRPIERTAWRKEFLDMDACAPGTDRIIVATQVVEAGVDISAGLLVTELAPWSSLVQRFGRCARRGGRAKVIVADLGLKMAKPYEEEDLNAAREALACLSDVAPLHLEGFEEEHPELLPRLYPYEPAHLLLRHELDELFDTTPDLTGADIDISRFIRSGEERDLQVFWADIDDPKANPPADTRPRREALCAVPFLKARDWLCGKESSTTKSPHLKSDMHAWIWNWLDGQWQRITERRDLYPGQTVLVAADCGGYDPERGWGPKHSGEVPTRTATPVPKTKKECWRLENGKQVIKEKEVIVISPAETTDAALDREATALATLDRWWQQAAEMADATQDSEDLSMAKAWKGMAEAWKTIATHGQETGKLARHITSAVAPNLAGLFDLAGRWHDAGKSHEAFQVSMRLDGKRPFRDDLAKAPDAAWPCSLKRMYDIGSGQRRPGFRHELASTLALFAVLQRHRPDHPALLGPWRELLTKAGFMPPPSPETQPPPAKAPNILEDEILALDAGQFDLFAYLVCAHHGKVRLTWHACPADQQVISPPAEGVAKAPLPPGEGLGRGGQRTKIGAFYDTLPAGTETQEKGNRMRIRGVCDGDELPPLLLTAADGTRHELPVTRLDLAPAAAGLNPSTGRGWTERVLGLLQRYGPFTLAWLEALLRAADQRASRLNSADPLLENPNGNQELETSDRTLAKADPGRTTAHSIVPDTPQSGPQHGLRGGAGGREDAGSRTRTPHQSTRYLTTTPGHRMITR